ncbi:MAG: MerR family transcriptional regulator [Rhodospirillaceae bacterium]
MTDTGNLSARRGGKSAAAFRTISEVANDLEVPQHVLRFWETKFSQVRPMKRGGGRRYYRPEDVDLLRSIRGLLYDDGYTIKGVQKLLREGGWKEAESAPVSALVPAAAPAATTASDGGGIPADQRKELQVILGELEALRKLLGS